MEAYSLPQPLLSIAVPTFNRAETLAALLAVLLPQVAELARAGAPLLEVLIADNASPDHTPEVVAAAAQQFAAADVPLRVFRHAENIGSDANFAFCYEQARGTFFWLCGDDDVVVPGGLARVVEQLQQPDGRPAEVDMVYATGYGFREDYERERKGDPLGRRIHTVRSARKFAQMVNIMFTFISCIIVNKRRLEELPHAAPQQFVGTNLVQLAWSLPLLLQHRKSVVIWERVVAGREGQIHGYSIGHVFGERLAANVTALLPGRPDLQRPILNFALRRWMPSMIVEMRATRNETMQLDVAHTTLRGVFGRNPRYWLCVYPALKLPVPLARLYTRATVLLSKLIYVLHLPGFWRRETR